MQGWNWNSIFKRKGREKSADEQLPPSAIDTGMQGTAVDSTTPSSSKQLRVTADRGQKQAAEPADAPFGLPQHLEEDLQHTQVQQEEVQPAADRQTADHQIDEWLPAHQPQPDEELQPLQQRVQHRRLELQSTKRQQQSQRATPSKARKLPSTPSPARQQQQRSPQQSAGGRSIADLQRFAFDASKQQRMPTGAVSFNVQLLNSADEVG